MQGSKKEEGTVLPNSSFFLLYYVIPYGDGLLSSVADYGEVLSLQGSTADETAVDVSLSKETCSIPCVA